VWLLRAVGTLVAAGSVAACGSKPAPAPMNNGIAVSIAHPASRLFHRTLAVEGDVVSYDMPDVAAETQGKVLAVLVKPGDRVQRGQVLARLDAADMLSSKASARATLDHANALLADKRRILARNEVLSADDLIAKQILTASQADEQAAAADSRSAQAALEQANVTLSRTEIRAAFAGTVTARKAQPGMFATPGVALFTLASDKPATLQFRASEDQLLAIKPGMPLTVDVGTSAVRTTVRAVSPAIDPVSRNFTFEADVPAEAATLAPGHSLSGKVELGQETSLSLPEKCVQSIGPDDFVYEARVGKAHRVQVKSGVHEDGLVQLANVTAATGYIADGANFVSEGQSLQISGDAK